MKKGAAADRTAGAAGDLAAADEDVVAPRELRVDAPFAENVDHRRGMVREGIGFARAARRGDGVVDVAEIVIDRAAAGDPTDEVDAAGAEESAVDFGGGQLVAADDHRRSVAPEHEELRHVTVGGEGLLQRQIEGGIGLAVKIKTHPRARVSTGSP